MPQPQQRGIQAMSAIYTTAHGNTSPTQWARPGIEPTSSWILVRFVNLWVMKGTPCLFVFNESCNVYFSLDFFFFVCIFFFFATQTVSGSSWARDRTYTTQQQPEPQWWERRILSPIGHQRTPYIHRSFWWCCDWDTKEASSPWVTCCFCVFSWAPRLAMTIPNVRRTVKEY